MLRSIQNQAGSIALSVLVSVTFIFGMAASMQATQTNVTHAYVAIHGGVR